MKFYAILRHPAPPEGQGIAIHEVEAETAADMVNKMVIEVAKPGSTVVAAAFLPADALTSIDVGKARELVKQAQAEEIERLRVENEALKLAASGPVGPEN